MEKDSFPQRLTEIRKRLGCTQKQVAEALGVSDRTYSKWETGENEMDVSSLCRLAEFFGLSPADFFEDAARKEPTALRARLGALPPREAADLWFRLHYETLLGMGDSTMAEIKRDATVYQRPVPWAEVPEDPSEHRGKAPNTVTTYAIPNLMAIFAAGEDLNLSLLLEPNREGYAWIREEAEELGALFRILGMPGALPCLYFLMCQNNRELFSLAYLAKEAGVSEAEAGAFLAAAAPLGLVVQGQRIRRKDKEEELLYRGYCRDAMVGLLSLAKLLLRDEAARRRYGHMLGTNPQLLEKGETP